MLKATLIAGIGGFIGTVLRMMTTKICGCVWSGAFPLGVFMVNVIGCFLIGLFGGWVTNTKRMSNAVNIFLITGLCGGYTTFSAYADDMVTILNSGAIGMFWLYMGASVILGILGVALGMSCVKSKS